LTSDTSIQRTDIKAGVIKIATGYGKISPFEANVLKSAARAQKETGVPIITHTEKGTMGPEQADLLISEGADPKRIMIGHIGNADLKYQSTILEKGVYIAFDRLGIELIFPDSLSKACIIALVSMGYANRIFMSHDHVSVQLGKSPPRSVMDQVMPKWKLGHIFNDIVPDLKKAGVNDKQLHMILEDNPRRLFTGE
jgi:phosphotriesterase-related protein